MYVKTIAHKTGFDAYADVLELFLFLFCYVCLFYFFFAPPDTLVYLLMLYRCMSTDGAYTTINRENGFCF